MNSAASQPAIAGLPVSYLVLASRGLQHVSFSRNDVATAFRTAQRLRQLGWHTRVMSPGAWAPRGSR